MSRWAEGPPPPPPILESRGLVPILRRHGGTGSKGSRASGLVLQSQTRKHHFNLQTWDLKKPEGYSESTLLLRVGKHKSKVVTRDWCLPTEVEKPRKKIMDVLLL